MSDNHFVVLGIHGDKVLTVEGNVARVRMYVKGKEYDEDFDLPEIPEDSGIPRTEQTYAFLLKGTIVKRMKELEASK